MPCVQYFACVSGALVAEILAVRHQVAVPCQPSPTKGGTQGGGTLQRGDDRLVVGDAVAET